MLPTFTDEKLERYLGVWDTLIAQGQKSKLDVTLTEDYGSFAWPFSRRYTLTYGEERRELTGEQAVRVHAWLNAVGSLS